MKKIAWFFIALFLSVSLVSFAQAQNNSKLAGKTPNAPAASSASVSKDPIGEADALLTRGDDPAKDRQALSILASALPANGNNFDLLWRMARAYYYVGDFAANKEEKLPQYEKGIAIAKRAMLLKPDAVEGHFWLAANYGGQAQLVGALKALSTVKKIRNEMQTVVKIDPTFENGNAFLALGEIDRELPGVAGGNKKRALTTFEDGLKIAPNNLDLKVTLAKAYIEAGRKDEAWRLLEEIVKAQATTRIQREAQAEAQKMLGK